MLAKSRIEITTLPLPLATRFGRVYVVSIVDRYFALTKACLCQWSSDKTGSEFGWITTIVLAGRRFLTGKPEPRKVALLAVLSITNRSPVNLHCGCVSMCGEWAYITKIAGTGVLEAKLVK